MPLTDNSIRQTDVHVGLSSLMLERGQDADMKETVVENDNRGARTRVLVQSS